MEIGLTKREINRRRRQERPQETPSSAPLHFHSLHCSGSRTRALHISTNIEQRQDASPLVEIKTTILFRSPIDLQYPGLISNV